MIDAEIKKALECPISEVDVLCTECPYRTHEGLTCHSALAKDALDLINRQKAEIERLKEQVNLWQEEAGSVGCANEWLKASLKNAKAETIKEFAERLKEQYEIWDDDEYYFNYVTTDQIDNLVKEMVGDTE